MSRKNVVSSSISFVTTVVYVSFLLNLTTAVKHRGFSMKMIRSDSKESPLHLRYANLTQGEKFQRHVEQSKARAHYFGSARAAAYNRSISMDPDIVRIPVKYVEHSNYYIGELRLGTFVNAQQQRYRDLYLIIDTGSDLIWTQCHGGHNYFYQDRPLYDQENSRTYERIPCANYPQECDAEHCEDGLCKYEKEYVSDTKTSGHLASETITVNSDTAGGLESIDQIVMGCGIDQRNFGPVLGVPQIREGDHAFPPPIPATAPIAGILGLGQGSSNFSLVLQLDIDEIERRFEYCLEPYDARGIALSHTYLRFGSDARIDLAPVVLSTPIIKDQNFDTPYHLILNDISIDGKSLRFQPSDFKLKTGGTIIDSGAPFTVMRMRHFEKVKQALVEYFEDSGIPLADPKPNKELDTCFVITDGFTAFPEMLFHFQDADFVIRQRSGIFVHYVQERLLCLGIIGLDDDKVTYDVILGAMQQADKRIMYDLHAKTLKFTDERCNFGS